MRKIILPHKIIPCYVRIGRQFRVAGVSLYGSPSARWRTQLAVQIFLFFTVLLFLTGSVFAWGVTPGRATVDFTPGLEKKVTFSVVNTDHKDVEFVVSAQGELESRIFISNSRITMSSAEDKKEVSYEVRLPSELEPGLHTGEIVVTEVPSQEDRGETFIGATVAAAAQLFVNVPYPGKFAEVDLKVVPSGDGKISFFFPIKSVGDFDLAKVRISADIMSELNKKIATLESEEVISIPSGQRRELILRWDSSEVEPGEYKISASVLYDGETKNIERQFNVGEKRLNLVGIEVNEFKLGEIAKFEVLVENKWGEEVKDAFTEMVVYADDGNVLGKFKSPTYDITALEKILMVY